MNYCEAMLRETQPKVNSDRKVSFRGIVEFAARQGKSRGHVWAVLKGRRESPRISSAWQKFQQSKAA